MDNIVGAILQNNQPVTGTFFIIVLIFAILTFTDITSLSILAYDYSKIVQDREYWRLITCFVSSPWNLSLIFKFLTSINYMKRIEESFSNQPAYVFSWYLLSTSIIILVSKRIFDSLTGHVTRDLLFNFYMYDLLDTQLYLICRRTRQDFNFMGFLHVQAIYIPLLIPILEMYLYNTGIQYCVEKIIVNDLIFFLWDVFPNLHGFCILSPPWLNYRN